MIEIKRNYSLLPHNTFGVDVVAREFVEYTTKEDLIDFLKKGGLTPPFLHIGIGSNLLFLKDYEGTILHSKIKSVEVVKQDDESLILKVGSGYDWDELVAYTVENNWYGLENLSLIPGEVGSSAVQNIGAYGVEVKDVITQVDVVNTDGVEQSFTNAECQYKYRYSFFKESQNRNLIVTAVYFKLSKQECLKLDYGSLSKVLEGKKITLQSVRDAIIEVRESKLPDPKVIGNAGSFFMNPVVSTELFLKIQNDYPNMPHYVLNNEQVKIPAGWLIDVCGWKGKTLGNAGVHDKQALVLVNKGNATGREIVALASAIQADVKNKFGIEISPEVNFIG